MSCKPVATPEAIYAFLESLGDEADQIAANLEERGVKAHCGNVKSCAIAQVLQDVFEFPFGFGSTGYGNTDFASNADGLDVYGDPVRDTVVLHPDPVVQFIQKFDEREYPNLIADHDEDD